ncbi:RtcB family protein [Carboxylicivirga sp. N1Y90]|uniref:RtcB family protein n=1 Tax=Carboxylicivirga fragile TaxID=3417571 RepID=UPI003D353627|nr:RtcB family protein [Marinilabiliaceae bacterium N1Y90]
MNKYHPYYETIYRTIMGNYKLKGKDLKQINYKSDRAKSLAIDIMQQNFKHLSKPEKLKLLEDVLLNPKEFISHNAFSKLAEEFIGRTRIEGGTVYNLDVVEKSFKMYGGQLITPETIEQMKVAMQLPISVSGALMPDAHVGYGLPIGGVLATENSVMPYGIGLDIGCRMSLSIYDVPAEFIKRNGYQIKTSLKENTHFGIGKVFKQTEDHEVLDRSEFHETALLKQLHGKAKMQLGSSGSGNHFVEVGIVELGPNNRLKIPEGNYLGILAHSGSRGLGAAIASHYTQIAMKKCHLPKKAKHLAWLDLGSEAGQEYWLSMNLAGDYAKACHDVIHYKLAKSMGVKAIAKIENHHNFAWKEIHDGKELIVHRKGATPANKGQLGIIPANMIDPGYIVTGNGAADSLFSASHGAGRKMSRKKAKESITGSELKKKLKQTGVTTIGGTVDEAPMTYKNIEEVMRSQKDLVNIEGKFYPQIVRMDK